MKGRVNWDGKYSSMSIDWINFVEKPLKEGYFVEAFSAADAIIDSQLMVLLRQKYNSGESQDLINNLEIVKEETKFFGSGVLKILEKVEIIDTSLANKIRNFKGKRNIVCHNIKAEYSLISPIGYKTQDEWEIAVEECAKENINKAFRIFEELVELVKS